MSAQIEITNITGTYPVDVYVADAFGNNSSFLGTIVNALSLPQLYTLPAVFNSAPSVMVTLIDANGCEEFKILECLPVFPTPSVTPSVTSSLAVTPSVTPSISISVTPSVSNTPSISISSTPSVTPSISISVTPSVSNTPSISISSTPSVTPSISISSTPSVTPSISISATPSISVTPSTSTVGSYLLTQVLYNGDSGCTLSETTVYASSSIGAVSVGQYVRITEDENCYYVTSSSETTPTVVIDQVSSSCDLCDTGVISLFLITSIPGCVTGPTMYYGDTSGLTTKPWNNSYVQSNTGDCYIAISYVNQTPNVTLTGGPYVFCNSCSS